MNRNTLVLASFILLSIYAGVAFSKVCELEVERLGNRASVSFDWEAYAFQGNQKCDSFRLQQNLGKRVNKKTVVELTVKHFNFINYSLKAEVEEQEVAAYRSLEKLWQQVFGLPGIAAHPQFESRKIEPHALVVWLQALRDADHFVDSTVESYRQLIVIKDRKKLADQQTEVQGKLSAIEHRKTEAYKAVSNADPQTFLLFETIEEERHKPVKARIQAFMTSADHVIKGRTEVIPKKDSGTIVTVTLTPVNSKGEPLTEVGTVKVESASIDYFVHSDLPLMFHAGYTYSRLDDVEFETVQSATNADLFQIVKEEENSQDFTAFLSLQFASLGENDKHGALVTLGTSLNDPGEKIFVGATFRFLDRFYLTFGGASANVGEGGNKILDTIGEELETRELFDTFTKRKEWATFFAISFGVL